MAPAIMVLGPSRWVERAQEGADLEITPLEAREQVVSSLRRMGCEATLTEAHDRRAGEEHFDLFLRIVEEENVRTYLVFWPLGARLHGLEVELGHLLTEVKGGRLDPENIYLLAEERAAGIDAGDGTVAWSEPGKRTRYHEDLVAMGCPIRRWRTETGMLAQVRAIGLEYRMAWE